MQRVYEFATIVFTWTGFLVWFAGLVLGLGWLAEKITPKEDRREALRLAREGAKLR